MNNKATATSNYDYHGNDEPVECDVCNTSMTLSCGENFLICDSVDCDNEIELNLESDDE